MEKVIKAVLQEYYIIADCDERNWITREEIPLHSNTQVVGSPTELEGGAVLSPPVVTSKIKNVEGDLIYTMSGSVYKLGEMHKDYKAFIEAKEKNIPIVIWWCLFVSNTKGAIFSGNLITEDHEFVYGKIDSMDLEKNLVTLESGDIYYVHWINMSLEVDAFRTFGMQYPDGEWLTMDKLSNYGFAEKCKLKTFS